MRTAARLSGSSKTRFDCAHQTRCTAGVGGLCVLRVRTHPPRILALAAELGRRGDRHRGWTLVWGGGNVSAMGALATAARARGGWTVGVVPKMLVRREVADTTPTS